MRWALILLVGCSFQPGLADGGGGGGGSADAPDGPHGDAAGSDAALRADAMIDATASEIAFVQANVGEQQGSTKQAVTFTAEQHAGDLIVVAVGWFHPGSATSITDTSGNVYTRASAATVSSGAHEENLELEYTCNSVAAAAGSNVVTVTFASGGAAPDPEIMIAEYSGIATSACLDTAIEAVGTGSAVTSGPVTTQAAHELLIGFTKVENLAGSNADTGFTRRLFSGFGDIFEDRVVMTAGAYDVSATQLPPAGTWVIGLAGFRAAP